MSNALQSAIDSSVSSWIERAQQQRPKWASTLAQRSADALRGVSFPTSRDEDFRRLPLEGLYRKRFTHAKAEHGHTAIDDVRGQGLNLTFVNGQFQAELSTSLNELSEHGIVLLSQADPEVLDQHIGQALSKSRSERHPFAYLNGVQADEGVLVHVKANQALNAPLYINHVESHHDEADALWCSARALIVLESSAQATVVERYMNHKGESNSQTNAVTEFSLAANAELSHYRIQTLDDTSAHIGATHGLLMRDARYRGVHVSFGSALTRNDLVLHMLEKGADANIAGFYIPRGEHTVDFHTNIEHESAHCTSDQVFRGITTDTATGIFNGRIHIHPDAQKTLAELNNRNLLLSDTAQVYTKPELEIYADDVRCAHGATIAKIEPQAIFYLQSRGISKAQAQVLLSFGFVNEVLDAIDIEPLREQLRERLSHRLLDQALNAEA